MSKTFNLSEGMLNSISKNIQKANDFEAKENFKMQYIDINNIKRNKKKFLWNSKCRWINRGYKIEWIKS